MLWKFTPIKCSSNSMTAIKKTWKEYFMECYKMVSRQRMSTIRGVAQKKENPTKNDDKCVRQRAYIKWATHIMNTPFYSDSISLFYHQRSTKGIAMHTTKCFIRWDVLLSFSTHQFNLNRKCPKSYFSWFGVHISSTSWLI